MENETKKVKKVEPKLKSFYFPSYRRSVEAKNLEEATKLIEEQVKPTPEKKEKE
jgi:hypothetical protein